MSDKYAALKQAAELAGGDVWQAKQISGDAYVIRKGSYQSKGGFRTYQPIAEIDHKPVRDFVAAANPATILELLAERDADKRRISELETRTVALPDERFRYGESDYDDGFANGWNAHSIETKRALAEAGISLKIEGE